MILHAIVEQIDKIRTLSKQKEPVTDALDAVIDYLSGLTNLDTITKDFLSDVSTALSEELRKDNSDLGFINTMLDLIVTTCSLTSPYSTRCVICGTDWMASGLQKILKDRYHILPWNLINTKCIKDYQDTYFLVCDGKQGLSELTQVDPRKILYVGNYIAFQFLVFPQFYKIKTEFDEQATEVKGLVTGISYFRDDVQCKFLEPKFGTLANRSQDLYFDYKMFQYAYQKNPKIKYAVLGVTPYSLRYDESRAKTLASLLFPYYALTGTVHNAETFESYAKLYDEQAPNVELVITEEDVKRLFYVCFLPLTNGVDFNSLECFDERKMTEAQLQQALTENRSKYNKPYEDTIKENVKILEEYLSFLERHSIQCIVMLPPFTNWYKEHWEESYYQEVLQVVQELKKTYPFTLLDLVPTCFPDYYFRDYAHLNQLGAAKVASILNATLANIAEKER